MADPTNVVNPGLTNVADEAYDGLPIQVPAIGSTPASASSENKKGNNGNERPIVVDQEIIVGPSTNAGPVVAADASGNTKPVTVDQEITTGPSQNGGKAVDGGVFSPLSPNVTNTQQNTVVGQTYGNGTVTNVNVS
jgi:acyl dehydratase